MSLINPLFEAGEIIDNKLYYSHSNFNGLFCLDIDTQENKFICFFDDEYCIKRKHNKSIRWESSIVFLPGRGNFIDIFNVETKKITKIKLKRYSNSGDIANGVRIKGNKLIIVPFFMRPHKFELPIYQIDLENKKVVERWDINKIIKDKYKVDREVCLHVSDDSEDNMWMIVLSTNIVISLQIDTGKVDVYETQISDLYDICNIDNDLFLINESGNIFLWDFNKNKAIAVVDFGISERMPYRRIIKNGNVFYAIPEHIGVIYSWKSCCDQFSVEEIALCEKENPGGRFFSGYKLEGDFLYLIPDIVGFVFRVDLKTHEVLIINQNVMDSWIDEEQERLFLKNVLKTIYWENEDYGLDEYCSDVLKM